MSAPRRVPHLIGGTPLEGPVWFDVIDPGKPANVVGQAVNGSPEHVDLAVEAALKAGDEWAAASVQERATAIEAGLVRIADASEDLAKILVAENGALLREARMDIQRSLELSKDLIQRAITSLAPQLIEESHHSVTILHRPIGVVGLMVPWNSPMVLAASKVAPALVAGNTIVLKPSPEAPIALTAAMELLASELPPGVLNVINSAGGGASQALTAHPLVRKISFTGSTEVGRLIMAAASTNLKRVSFELGGNDAAIVLDDVDIQTAIESLASGVFTRAGQVCFGVKRIYVARSRYDEFVEAFCAHVDNFVCGHGSDPESTYGPVINARQIDRLNKLIDEAKASGAIVRVLGRTSAEGERSGGFYMRPTVVTNIDQSATLVSEEQFGPVIPVIPFDDDNHAVSLANDSEFGLASSVWSSDQSHAMDVAARIDAGCTFINSHNIWSLSFEMPFGGTKQSGLGRERTEIGLNEYIETHAIRAPRLISGKENS
jgi:acyl-CoA reductase-like NAD-dependent aldehyde dehydrogenase